MTTFITRDELRAAHDDVTVVDALPPAPYGLRHVPGALNLVAEDADEHVLGVLPDKAAQIRHLLDRHRLHARPGPRRAAGGARLRRRARLP